MWNGNINYRTTLVLCAMISGVVLFSRCMNQETSGKSDTDGYSGYADASTCAGCHKDVYEKHQQTAHALTGLPADEKNIKGSFEKGKNTYAYTPDILLAMEKRDSGMFQVVHFKGEEKKAMRFDMIIGSGVMGQSFLTWRGDQLFQLPITYFTAAAQWSNSPGFPPRRVMIDRPVTARCLECHVTYAEGIGGTAMEPTGFLKNRMIYGIDCQKCHGPAKEHVMYHEQNPDTKNARHIVNPQKLSPERQIDICALCHGGNIQKTKPSFSFRAGTPLSSFFTVDSLSGITQHTSAVDVHGNQVGLLKASTCFRMSPQMTCSTCHNTHENERGNLALFSKRCMSCHNTDEPSFKSAAHQSGTIKQNCIDCHMPAQPSKSIAVFLQGEETPKASLLRTHYISIYPEKK